MPKPNCVIARSVATKQSFPPLFYKEGDRGSSYKSFSNDLTHWYHQHKRDLPWRRTKDPYKIWVSEIMLQQTTVSTVIAYYQRWIKVFPTVHDLARAPLQA